MPAAAAVDRVDQTGQSCGLPASSRTGDQNQTLFQMGKGKNLFIDVELLRIRKDKANDPQHRGQRSTLAIDIDTETPHLRK